MQTGTVSSCDQYVNAHILSLAVFGCFLWNCNHSIAVVHIPVGRVPLQQLCWVLCRGHQLLLLPCCAPKLWSLYLAHKINGKHRQELVEALKLKTRLSTCVTVLNWTTKLGVLSLALCERKAGKHEPHVEKCSTEHWQSRPKWTKVGYMTGRLVWPQAFTISSVLSDDTRQCSLSDRIESAPACFKLNLVFSLVRAFQHENIAMSLVSTRFYAHFRRISCIRCVVSKESVVRTGGCDTEKHKILFELLQCFAQKRNHAPKLQLSELSGRFRTADASLLHVDFGQTRPGQKEPPRDGFETPRNCLRTPCVGQKCTKTELPKRKTPGRLQNITSVSGMAIAGTKLETVENINDNCRGVLLECVIFIDSCRWDLTIRWETCVLSLSTWVHRSQEVSSWISRFVGKKTGSLLICFSCVPLLELDR